MASVKYVMALALIASLLIPVVSATNDVDFIVIDKHGDEIEDADVKLINSTDGTDCTDNTNNKGEATCSNLDDGDYTIEATHDDYQDFENDEALNNLHKDLEVVVVMRPKKVDLTVHVIDDSKDDIEDAKVTIEGAEKDKEDDHKDFDDYGPDEWAFPDGKSRYEGYDKDDDDKTDKDGEVEFKNIESDTEYNITVTKNGYIKTSVLVEIDFAVDDTVKITLSEPGTATFTAIVRDQESNDPLKGVTVNVVSRGTGDDASKETNNNGEAEFELDTPDCYDIAVELAGYSTDSQTDLCLGNDDDITSPFYITSQNNLPTADAGADQFVIVGDEVTLDASASSDADGDDLTYAWEDSLGTEIPDGVSPTVTFDTAGDHEITLTVSDGTGTSTATVTVVVESPENCGDNVCSLSERNAGSCPVDCPTCKDDVCGAGEGDPAVAEYCPLDCGISVALQTINKTIYAGNSTTLSIIDSKSGRAVLGAAVLVTAPNGSVIELIPIRGEVDFTFADAGEYTIELSSPDYAGATTTITVESLGMDLSWLLWVVLIIVAIVVILFVIRYVNMNRGGAARGYRAKRYRRGKPTLSSV